MDTWKDEDVIRSGYFADGGNLGFELLSSEDISTEISFRRVAGAGKYS